MKSKEVTVLYGRPIAVEARPNVFIELTEQGPQGAHGEKGDKGDTGTVTPEMLDILSQTKASAAEAAESVANATNQASQANDFKNNTYGYYQQAVQVKIEIQSIKDAATKDVADAAKSLVTLAANSEKAINDVTNPALTEIRSSKAEADAAINEVRQARDAAKSSAVEAQASAVDAQASATQTATDANNVTDAYNKIKVIETNVTTLADKTDTAEKSVADNYQANQVLKSDIDATKTAIDDRSDKVSQALSDAQKAAKDALKSATDAANSVTAASSAQKTVENAVIAANDAATAADNSATVADASATAAKDSETAAADYLSKSQTLADKIKALKPEFDETVEKNNAINDQISATKSAIEGLSTSTQENADKAAKAANKAATSETHISATAEKVAVDKTTVVDTVTTVTDLLDQVNISKDSVDDSLDKVNATEAKVEKRWNDFSTIYYGASPTEPTGDVKLGALWLDTSETPEVLKKYLSTGWEIVASTDFFTKSEVQEMLKALSADKINETDNAKIMTGDERTKLAGINPLVPATWNAGTDVTEALISPMKLRDAINARFEGDLWAGWARMPNGLLLQWGNVQSSGSADGWAVFPTAFKYKCYFLPTMDNAWTGDNFLPIVFADWGDNVNLGSKHFYCRRINDNGGVILLKSWNVQWLAIGF